MKPKPRKPRKPETIVRELAPFQVSVCGCGPYTHKGDPRCLATDYNKLLAELRQAIKQTKERR